jgi:hypothetical protein
VCMQDFGNDKLLQQLGDCFIQLGIKLKANSQSGIENDRLDRVRSTLLPILIFTLRSFGFDLPVNFFVQFEVPEEVRHLALVKNGNLSE